MLLVAGNAIVLLVAVLVFIVVLVFLVVDGNSLARLRRPRGHRRVRASVLYLRSEIPKTLAFPIQQHLDFGLVYVRPLPPITPLHNSPQSQARVSNPSSANSIS